MHDEIDGVRLMVGEVGQGVVVAPDVILAA
jgi:hypothetical protein